MKIVYISNFLNHHQTTLWDKFVEHDVDFTFLSTSAEQSPIKPTEKRPYNLFSRRLSDGELTKFINDQDVIMIGSNNDKRLHKIISKRKDTIIFLNSEHLFKSQRNILIRVLSFLKTTYVYRKRYKNKNFYVLANSAHLGKELNRMGLAKNRIYRFGYYPKTNDNESLIKNRNIPNILGVGRMLKWKKHERAIDILREFLKHNDNYTLSLFGEGPHKQKIERYVRERGLMNKVFFSSFVPHEKIIEEMLSHSVFTFTSNRGEGWGATLNEALSCGCIIIASRDAGSTPYLIKDGLNGYSYSSRNQFKDIVNKIELMAPEDVLKMRERAFHTIKDLWNEEVAAQRLFCVIKAILEKSKIPEFDEGPLSKE